MDETQPADGEPLIFLGPNDILPQLPSDLLAQVAAARQALRTEKERTLAELAAEREKVARLKAQTVKFHAQAKAERTRARAVTKRFYRRLKAKWAGERTAIEADRARLIRERDAHAEAVERFEADRDRNWAQTSEYKRRLYDAWELLGENQRRLLADRQQAERWADEQAERLALRVADVTRREREFGEHTGTLEARVGSLVTEIAGLEARALHTRAILRQLEDQRAKTEAGANASHEPAAVSLQPPVMEWAAANEANHLVADLRDTRQAVLREHHKLAAAKTEIERRAVDLADQRSILAEQVAALAAARDLWQTAEHRTLVEMEGLARAVRAREQEVALRERSLAEAEQENRGREHDLGRLRAKLEGWQAALGTHEATAAAARDHADAEGAAKRAHLARWEESLEQTARTWAAVRERERQIVHAEADRLAEACREAEAATTEADAARRAYLAEAGVLAARLLATEDNPRNKPSRRERVLRKRWEAHFTRFRRELTARVEAADAARIAADDHRADARAAFADALDRYADEVDRRTADDRERIAAARTADEHAGTLSLEAARRERTERALAEVRGEIERLATLLMVDSQSPAALPPHAEPDVIALMPVRAA